MPDQDALNNAAALMLMLGDAEAGAVMRQLSAGQAQALKQAIARIDPGHRILGPQPPVAPGLQVVEVDVAIDMPGDEPAGAGAGSRLLSESSRYVRSLLHQAFGAAFQSPPSTQAAPRSGIQSVRQADLAAVAHLLVAEHPQVAAALLAWLDRGIAAQVLQLVPPRLRAELLLRTAGLGPIRPDTAQALDAALAGLLGDQALRRAGPQGGVAAAADLLHRLGAQREGPVLEAIRAQDADLAQRIEDRLATRTDTQPAKA
jgi:flagellar motor switch protein FliG